MKRKIKINDIALKDIVEIKEYIRMENINAIKKFTKEIRDTFERLAEFPNIGISLSNIIRLETEYRYIISKGYIIFYKYDSNNIYIYRIISDKRDYMKILFN